MKTDDLIKAIVADNATVTPPIGRMIAAALALGVVLAAFEFSAFLSMRPDFWQAISHDPRFIFKFAFTVAIAIPAAFLVARLSRPDGRAGALVGVLAAPIAALLIAIAIEMLATSPATWSVRALGTMPGACMKYIPLLSIAPFVSIFAALRYGAPSNPVAAGAAAGLASAAIGAAIYATFCVDDSPMFVAIWYVGAIAIVTALGAMVGKLSLRW